MGRVHQTEWKKKGLPYKYITGQQYCFLFYSKSLKCKHHDIQIQPLKKEQNKNQASILCYDGPREILGRNSTKKHEAETENLVPIFFAFP